MNNIYKLLGLSAIAIGLTACQTTARQYNGNVGYQVENKTEHTATIAYTLAGRKNQSLDESKLQNACAKVLGKNKVYSLKILSINEIINSEKDVTFGRQIGQSRTSIGLSNTPNLYNSEDYATRQALDARPATLHVVRYTCS
ncbi:MULTISPECIES: hypothetical protein [unclassified Acinetobacter]|uniref:hypothetical protein n=1 Tax=unclassified Acinetobacter TaxID=196816 RepID=UPI00293521B4|nr:MULTISPECIES: hypothetical protein [unclassified Acinetobacter]WOE31434.1 hypothetical protein QSG84_14145 [Acinetobacter sp. SAAs470]WOE39630.1 hypothetical protein QSG86_07810 [Acinetobacter sp. SAAs474]